MKQGRHDAIRGTWGQAAKALGIEVRYFVGASNAVLGGQPGRAPFTASQRSDEVILDCHDDYDHLPQKTKAICLWAAGKMLDHIFLADTDTFLVPRKLLTCGYEPYDYVGKIDRDPAVPFDYTPVDRHGEATPGKYYPWASGGYGYFLSKKAFFEVASNYPDTWAEDLWVAQVLGPLIAKGEMTALSTPRNVYSWHHPEHGEIYNIEKLADWMNEMQRTQR